MGRFPYIEFTRSIESDEDEIIHIPGVVGCTRRFALVDSSRSSYVVANRT